MITPPAFPVAVIVLAGGRSSRMGAHKLLLPLGDAPIIVQSARAALASGLRPIMVVVGHAGDAVRAVLAGLPVAVRRNAQYHEGLASSLRAGIAALGAEVAGAIVTLGDQPLIPAAHFAALATHARTTGAAMVATRYADHDGSPVYFARRVFGEVARLRGDQGARALLAAGGQVVEYVPLADAGAALDIDTHQDYVRARRIWDARYGRQSEAGS